VGFAAVQLAALRGATVTGLTSLAKADTVRDQGASETLDRDAKLPENNFDAVIDVVGGPQWSSVIDAIKPSGHYAVSGAIAGPMVTADLRRLYLRDATIHGATHQSPQVFARLVALMNTGRIRPLISKTYKLAEIALAQREFQSKSLSGKLVLIP